MEKKRIEWLDAAKAIGVYLVILGHLVIFNYHTYRFIYAFHMPFFFIAAGYVWKKSKDFKTLLKKSIKHYILPYLVITILGILQCFLFPVENHNLDVFYDVKVLEISFYGGAPIYSYFGPAWFLLAMFWAQLLFYGLIKISEKSKKYISILLWICLIALAVFSKDIVRAVPYFWRLPLKIDSALMATVFIGIGFLLKKSNILKNIKWYVSVLIILVGGFTVWLFGCKWNYYVSVCDLEYAKIHNFFIAALFGSVMLFEMGRLIQKSKLVKFIGRNTLFIFLAHQIVCIILIYLANLCFERELHYQAMPLNGWSIGISIVTLAICTLLAWGYAKFKKMFSTLYKRWRDNKSTN